MNESQALLTMYGTEGLRLGYDDGQRTAASAWIDAQRTRAPDRAYDRQWDRLETRYALRRFGERHSRQGTALWWEEAYAELEKRQRIAAERERQRRQLEDIRATHGADPLGRASAYLAHCDAGESGNQRNPHAWKAVLYTVRGFALDEGAAMDLLMREYAARCRPAIAEREMRGMVRRALSATRPELGYLLVERKR